ncbi:LysR substrate-binding domain-containing protein [Kitasatospora aburaviensis]
MAPPGTLCHTMAVRACESAGFAPRIRHQIDDFATVLALVAAGQGWRSSPTWASRSPRRGWCSPGCRCTGAPAPPSARAPAPTRPSRPSSRPCTPPSPGPRRRVLILRDQRRPAAGGGVTPPGSSARAAA